MGLLSGLGNVISKGIESAVNFIGKAFTSVESGVAKFAQRLFTPFPEIDLAIRVISLVVDLVNGVAEILGIKPEKEKVEELGAKAQDAELKQENFETTEKYLEYLRNEVEFDKEKFDKMSREEQWACRSVGTALYAKNIEEKTGLQLSPDFLLMAGSIGMKAKELITYFDSFKENNLRDMKLMSDYLTGKLDEKTDAKVESAIVDGLKKLNPDMSEKSIQSKLGEMTEAALNPEGN